MEWILLIFILALQIWSIGLYYKWEGYNKKKGENLAMKEASRDINYEGEKGRNLATKEDIAQITKEIESVKDSYNKALEAHKIELQKEFESHKYIMTLCHSLDNTLLQYIASCLKADAEKGIIYPENDDSLLMENNKLSNFLYTYKGRYDSIPVLRKLREISGEIDTENENLNLKSLTGNEEYIINLIPPKKKKLLMDALNKSLMYFIPALVPQNKRLKG